MSSNGCVISTYAFLDIETTGLPDLIHGKPNITELSICAISRDDLLNTESGRIPRIIDKLTLCFNPSMTIQPLASTVSGLDNYMLENNGKLDENAAKLISGFIDHLRPMVCLVAHNGDTFDFPILKHSFKKLNRSLHDNILSIDSLKAFRNIDRKLAEKESSKIDSKNSIEIVVYESNTETETNSEIIFDNNFNAQNKNEVTPKRKTIQKLYRPHKRNLLSNVGEKQSELKSVRALFPSIPVNKETSVKAQTNRKSYKLVDIYERIFGSKPNQAHHAEDDVVSLEKIAIAYGKQFTEYAEANAVKF